MAATTSLVICSVLLVLRPFLPSRATVRTLPWESTLSTRFSGLTSVLAARALTQSATLTALMEGASRLPSSLVRNSTHWTLSERSAVKVSMPSEISMGVSRRALAFSAAACASSVVMAGFISEVRVEFAVAASFLMDSSLTVTTGSTLR